MKACVLDAPAPIAERPLRIAEVPRPSPGENEVLIRVQACGVCRTDLHVVEGDLPQHLPQVTPGHQVVGEIAELGSDVRGFSVADRVGVAWLRWTCGECRFCRAGRENLCERAQFTGYHADGGYAEYAVVPEAFAYPIPDVFGDAEAAPLLCAGIIGYRALRLSAVPPGG